MVVVANSNLPESVDLAHYYMARRSIPSNRLCILDLPAGEVISREDYRSRLREPLLRFLESAVPGGRAGLRGVVSVYGVPLRIADTPSNNFARLAGMDLSVGERTDAAVDSELSRLLYTNNLSAGPLANPIYDAFAWPEPGGAVEHLLVAARLDGPSPETARRMLDDSLAAEWYGLQGRAYFDNRTLGPDLPGQLGQAWILEACERFMREGYECEMDRALPCWGEAYPMENAAVYMGWYAEDVVGPFLRRDFKFMPGAVVYHLHSGSASTLRSLSSAWAGPLLARGAAATLGAVREPYLAFTPHLDILARRLCDGFSFGESAYMSLSAVSWQIAVIGDPLYTPFKYSLDEQVRHLEADRRPEVEWAYIRKINLMVREGRFNIALEFCRRKIAETGSLALREKLGDLLARNELFEDAGREYEEVLARTGSRVTALRVGSRWMLILRLTGQEDRAKGVEKALRLKWKDDPMLKDLAGSQP